MRKNLKSWGKRCFAYVLSFAVTFTTVFPHVAATTTVKAAENDEEPYVVSANRPVYASSEDQAGSLAVDGDITTRWESERGNPEDTGWIYVDLGKVTEITSVYLKWEAAAAAEYRIQFSDDEAEWKTVKTVTDGTEGDERTFDISGNTRYVRVQCDKKATNYGYSLFEFQVYGLDGLAPRPVDYGTNLALNKDTKASSARVEWWMRVGVTEENFDEKVDELFTNGYPVDADGNLLTDSSEVYYKDGYICYGDQGNTVSDQRNVLPKKSVDGVVDNNGWHTNGGDASKRNNDQWMYVDLGAEYEIGRIILNWQDAARAYKIQISNDAENWTTIYSKMNEYALEKNIPIYAKGRYVRLYCLAPWDFSSGIGVKELQIFQYKDGDEKKTYEDEIEEEPEITTVSVENSDATYATDDVRFPMAKPPVYMDESLQDEPVDSNDWWQSIAIKDLGNGLVVMPYRVKYSASGLDIVEVNDCWYPYTPITEDDNGAGGLGTATTNSKTDFTLTPEGMDTTEVYDKVVGYSDYAVKTQLCDANGPVMTNTFVKGSPYLFAEFGNTQDAVIYSTNITGIYDDNRRCYSRGMYRIY